jgi:hypothetical protein
MLRRRTEKTSERRRNYPPGNEGREIRIVERLVASCGGNMRKASSLSPVPSHELTDDPSAHRRRRIDGDGIVMVGTEDQGVGQHPMLSDNESQMKAYVGECLDWKETMEEEHDNAIKVSLDRRNR